MDGMMGERESLCNDCAVYSRRKGLCISFFKKEKLIKKQGPILWWYAKGVYFLKVSG